MADDTKTDRAPSRWMRLLLIASLALNLLIVGLVAGAFLAGGKPGSRGAEGREFQRQPLIGALDPSVRRDVVRELRETAGRPREHSRDLRGRFRAYLGALRAEEFDITRVEQLLAEQRASMGGWQDAVDAALLKKLAEMTEDERLAYADRLEELGKRWRKRR